MGGAPKLSTGRSFGPGNASGSRFNTMGHTRATRSPGEPSLSRWAKVVALDPNHKNFAYSVGSDSKATEIKNPYFLKSFDKRIDQLKSKRDRCKRKSRLISRQDGSHFLLPSRRWLMLNARLQNVYRKRREQTKQFVYTLANHLYHDYMPLASGTMCPTGAVSPARCAAP
ncbi:MAG: hypothetical protein AUH05_22640 [Ktedonobacter sp. 13_2_20CM_53_11]|nr:MAG: hypothetical protein AUH05_22640 [Ktedonobacter sp. 13_2_20CM_53_11]